MENLPELNIERIRKIGLFTSIIVYIIFINLCFSTEILFGGTAPLYIIAKPSKLISRASIIAPLDVYIAMIILLLKYCALFIMSKTRKETIPIKVYFKYVILGFFIIDVFAFVIMNIDFIFYTNLYRFFKFLFYGVIIAKKTSLGVYFEFVNIGISLLIIIKMIRSIPFVSNFKYILIPSLGIVIFMAIGKLFEIFSYA